MGDKHISFSGAEPGHMGNEHDLEHPVRGSTAGTQDSKAPPGGRPPSSLLSAAGHEADPPGPGSPGVVRKPQGPGRDGGQEGGPELSGSAVSESPSKWPHRT